MHADYRKLLETACMSCVIDIVSWKHFLTEADANEPTLGTVNVGLISNHCPIEHRSWRGRLPRAIAALRARDYPFLEFYTPAELEAFNVALREAGEVAFPKGATE